MNAGEPILGLCIDIDGYWWNGHGPGSHCPHCRFVAPVEHQEEAK